MRRSKMRKSYAIIILHTIEKISNYPYKSMYYPKKEAHSLNEIILIRL